MSLSELPPVRAGRDNQRKNPAGSLPGPDFVLQAARLPGSVQAGRLHYEEHYTNSRIGERSDRCWGRPVGSLTKCVAGSRPRFL